MKINKAAHEHERMACEEKQAGTLSPACHTRAGVMENFTQLSACLPERGRSQSDDHAEAGSLVNLGSCKGHNMLLRNMFTLIERVSR